MRFDYFKRKQREYHSLLERHFPALLEKMAAEKPDALVFVDSSARPFAYLTKRLWSTLGLGKEPQIRFVNPVPGWVATTVKRRVAAKELEPKLERHRNALREFAKRHGWRGKKIIVFDDYVLHGHTLSMLRQELELQGALVKTAAFSAPAGGFVDFAAINHTREPYWDALLSREIGKLHVKPPNKVELRGLAHLRQKMSEVAEKILEGRKN